MQLEMERALLEGEQQMQLEQLDAAREKVAALEAKESQLLTEAAAERLKVMTVSENWNSNVLFIVLFVKRHVLLNEYFGFLSLCVCSFTCNMQVNTKLIR
jgi:hypothetical protein